MREIYTICIWCNAKPNHRNPIRILDHDPLVPAECYRCIQTYEDFANAELGKKGEKK